MAVSLQSLYVICADVDSFVVVVGELFHFYDTKGSIHETNPYLCQDDTKVAGQ